MNWNININQKAIVKLNKSLANKLDVKDAIILEWMLKFHAEPKSKKLMLGENVYFWASYRLILDENPLLEIENKQTCSRRISKLVEAGLLLAYISESDGNKTYFSITQACFDLLNRDKKDLSTQKSIPIDSKVNTLLTQKSNNNNIRIISTTTCVKTILSKNIILHENLKMQYGNIDLEKKINEFVAFIQNIKKEHQSESDVIRHFVAWLPKNIDRIAIENVEKQLSWLIKMFNKISKGNWVATDEVRKLFRKQLANGFTGVQMQEAVKNMFSSSDSNKWHKENKYATATPVHLLSYDNVNKYLNQRF